MREEKIMLFRGLMTGKARLVQRLVGGLPSVNWANPQPPLMAYLFESLTMNSRFVGAPVPKDCSRPKTALFSADGMDFQASRAMRPVNPICGVFARLLGLLHGAGSTVLGLVRGFHGRKLRALDLIGRLCRKFALTGRIAVLVEQRSDRTAC
jgi:hypothetical protein